MIDHVVITTLDGGTGPFRIAATRRGIAAAEWQPDADAFVDALRTRLHAPVVPLDDASARDPAADVLRRAIPVMEALLRGERLDPDGVEADLSDRPMWDRTVLSEVRRVRWGDTASYGDIARRIGAPRAARAVGGALGRNPVSLLIPCHRIIAGDGTLGGYGGTGWIDRDRQRSRKEALLLREGITVRRRDG
ncbi:MAG TPA: methylated-DNA--[protein]-cysteine S-methyltransferase [Candidatus Limnocylindrales bacterium]|nr:methylated-DNA--[protein]-cysteine S-methyltransferase [Candidatus Limnocylindrales bacterium]